MRHYFPKRKKATTSKPGRGGLSKAERKFLERLEAGDISGYSQTYKRHLKHVIIKRKYPAIVEGIAQINGIWDKLRAL